MININVCVINLKVYLPNLSPVQIPHHKSRSHSRWKDISNKLCKKSTNCNPTLFYNAFVNVYIGPRRSIRCIFHHTHIGALKLSHLSVVSSQMLAHSQASRSLAEIFTSNDYLAMACLCRAQTCPRSRDNREGQRPKPRPRTKTALSQESRAKTRNHGSTLCKEGSKTLEFVPGAPLHARLLVGGEAVLHELRQASVP